MPSKNDKNETEKNSKSRVIDRLTAKGKTQVEMRKSAEVKTKMRSIGIFSFVSGLILTVLSVFVLSVYHSLIGALYVFFFGIPVGPVLAIFTIVQMAQLRKKSGKLPFNIYFILGIIGILLCIWLALLFIGGMIWDMYI